MRFKQNTSQGSPEVELEMGDFSKVYIRIYRTAVGVSGTLGVRSVMRVG